MINDKNVILLKCLQTFYSETHDLYCQTCYFVSRWLQSYFTILFLRQRKHTQQLLYSTHQTLKPFVSHVVKLIEKVINSLYGQAFIQGISSCVRV